MKLQLKTLWISLGIITIISLLLISITGFTEIITPVLIAFIGGVLSLLSPCSAVLLPGFFAYTFKEKKQLIKMTFIFWLGLATIFIPLGFTASFISQFINNNIESFILISGWLFIILGLITLTDVHVKYMMNIRMPRFLRVKSRDVGSIANTYLMGVMFAFTTGTCIAPIIGGIYTLAATQSNAIMPTVLLTVYSLGLVAPLFIAAWFFEKKQLASSSILKGKMIKIPFTKVSVHSTKLIASLIFIGIGLVFIFSRGTHALIASFEDLGLIDFYLDANYYILNNSDLVSRIIITLLILFILIYIGYLTFKNDKTN